MTTRSTLAVITGAGGGIGSAIAHRLSRDHLVALHHGADLENTQALQRDIEQMGGQAFVFHTDLSRADAGTEFWAAYERAALSAGVANHPVNVLVNNAGIARRGEIEQLSDEDFDRQHQVNTRSPYMILKHGLGRLSDGGRIVNLSSSTTHIAYPDLLAYGMSKAAIDALTHTLAQQLGPRGITVNAVAPGVVDTNINADWLQNNPEAQQYVGSQAALGRVAQPNDIADVVAFLASDSGRWITGQTIVATGGAHL
ncbi:SDR family NAD(P)-dependent oxidoreductase [Deinococcus radiopugnans]|uniref:NAD(P)-dependent dehydrogenase (Short-subunit alcohol dehydrogenase family) n=1 Tax=Deinococcus radiopugnans ATCC 19172 TaxID=585398 RepID=A0A5C4Y8V3_9DEIO|nr:SDR family oxidoreductase [Deinococcus radiopugnans]MBB6015969.1 NAD(P)-dependent dehydrogenase (short-subunit alcohol dehydrogenase family) [Deinococcus radiopugnans ATCC 19172]TNM72342.1 SDR family oxidoreductase [Deinococcus radiopugnans ATCC 19172]